MSHHGSWLDGVASLVGDASIWINLAATGRARQILECTPVPITITTTAMQELEGGRSKGRETAEVVADLIRANLVREVALSADDEAVFLDLVAGSTGLTLDDGEAATIASALSSGSVALIDERKATSLCNERYPGLLVRSTTDLLLASHIALTFQREQLADCLFRALSIARMRVPEHHLAEVCELLGPDRRRGCRSLPFAWRQEEVPGLAE